MTTGKAASHIATIGANLAVGGSLDDLPVNAPRPRLPAPLIVTAVLAGALCGGSDLLA